MIETIYIARHGFRMNWVNTNWKSATGLARDPPLAAFGETQAQELAEYFLSLPEDQRPTAIFSSPYYRCLQTAHPTAVALGLPLYVEHGLSEWFSPVTPGTGLHPRPAPASELTQYFSSIDAPAWSSVWYPPRKGEDVAEVLQRARDFLGTFVPAVEGAFPSHRRVLFVSHAATTIALARALLDQPEMPLRVGCCSLTEVVRAGSRWEPLRLADGKHLKEGTSRDWGFEDIEIANGQVVTDPGVPGTEDEVDDLVGPRLASNL